jgi:hypothetical protein
MRRLKVLIVTASTALLLGALVLCGCSRSSGPELRLQWMGTSGSDEMVYQYATFTGSEEGAVRVEAEETVVLAYAATVDKGVLAFEVQSPSTETMWETTLTGSIDEQQVELTLPEAGVYTILAIGEETGGSFDLSWSVR